MKFRVGDNIMSKVSGRYGVIEQVDDSTGIICPYLVRFNEKDTHCPSSYPYWTDEDSIELVNESVNNNFKSNIMDLKEKFVLAVTPEPQKSFRKAEITDGDNLLTQDGQRIFLTWLLGKYADEFKTAVVDGLLKKAE